MMKPNDKAIEAAIRYLEAPMSAREQMEKILTAAFAAQFPPSEDYAELVKWLRDKAESLSEIYPPEAEAADALEAVLAERDALKDILPNQSHEGRAPIPTDWWSVAVLERRKRRAAEKERDALKAELIDYKDAAASEADFVNELEEKIRELNVEIDKWESAYKEITDTRVKIEETTVDKLKKVESERDAFLARLAPVEDDKLVAIMMKQIIDATSDMPPRTTYTISERSLAGSRAAIAAIRPHIEAAERERCAKAVEKVAERINVAHHERPEWEDGYLQGVHDAAAAIRREK